MADDLVLWQRADSDEVIRRVLLEPSGNPYPAMRSYGDAEVVLAYTTAGATARSGTTLGTGTATSRWLSESGANRVINTTSDSISYFNLSSTQGNRTLAA
jgi:hypothetical protein